MAKQAKQIMIDEKEQQAITRTVEIAKKVLVLTDKQTGLVRVTSQQEADLAGEIVKEISQQVVFVTNLWREEADMAHKLHISLTGKISKYCRPFREKIDVLKGAAKLWFLAEARKREEEQTKLQAQVDEDIPDSGFVVQIPKTKVEGFSPRTVWTYQVVDIKALAKAVGSGKVSPHYITGDHDALKHLAEDKHDMADKDGFILPGVKVVKDLNMARRSS